MHVHGRKNLPRLHYHASFSSRLQSYDLLLISATVIGVLPWWIPW
jgi:hypothetical protein